MVCIAYFTQFTHSLTQLLYSICDNVQNDTFVAKIVNMSLTNNFMAIFASDERLPSSATLVGGIL